MEELDDFAMGGEAGTCGEGNRRRRCYGDQRKDGKGTEDNAIGRGFQPPDPAAVVESQQQVRPGDQRVRDADVSAEVTSDDYVVAWGEGALRRFVPDAQCWWG